jgi:exopolysaccharide biosynthesis polyprenyl glycosylphosphotransferase
MLKEKERAVNNFLASIDVAVALLTFNAFLLIFNPEFFTTKNNELILLNLFVVLIWFFFSKVFRLGELYRSRPYSVVLFNCFGLAFLGSGILGLVIFLFKIENVALVSFLSFAIVNTVFTFFEKVFIYSLMKMFRRRGLNSRSVVIVGDKSAIPFIRQMFKTVEWGYRIVALVGENDVFHEFNDKVTILDSNEIDVDKLLEGKSIDELIYCCDKPDMNLVETLLYSCDEVGVTFRMHSSFFNMLTSKMHLHYFDTTPVLSFANTPQNYMALRIKRFYDLVVSFSVILFLSPVFVFVAALIKISSPGPVFFKQKRVGVRGRKFWVYKFRTMVINAEELKQQLMEQNEMDGPVFKMTNDPRITPVGRFLRKTSLDELPQFFNVLMGDMSIVGPRPPLPKEVKEYERWQLRRLSMKPGITCIWQISPSRNDISFDDWMRMDLEYIDNWSLKLDFILVLKTVRTMLRADGK